jgi:hypothetical protein
MTSWIVIWHSLYYPLYLILEAEHGTEEGLIEYRAVLLVTPLHLKQNIYQHVERSRIYTEII